MLSLKGVGFMKRPSVVDIFHEKGMEPLKRGP